MDKEDYSITFVVAAYKIPKQRILNFIEWNKDLFEKYKAKTVVVSDRLEDYQNDNFTCLVYPHEQKVFSIPKTINYGIRSITDDGIIIKTDIDIFFTEEVIRFLIDTVKEKIGAVCFCHLLSDEAHVPTAINQWGGLSKVMRGYGACFAMYIDDWYTLCGYNENISGWGGDDTDMYHRASRRIKIVCSAHNPLFHIHHDIRKSTGTGDFFEIKSKNNLHISRKQEWNIHTWGMLN